MPKNQPQKKSIDSLLGGLTPYRTCHLDEYTRNCLAAFTAEGENYDILREVPNLIPGTPMPKATEKNVAAAATAESPPTETDIIRRLVDRVNELSVWLEHSESQVHQLKATQSPDNEQYYETQVIACFGHKHTTNPQFVVRAQGAPKFPNFDGKDSSAFRLWIVQFLQVLNIYKLTEENACHMALACMTGPAVDSA